MTQTDKMLKKVVAFEIKSAKTMRKDKMFQLLAELITERVEGMSDYEIMDYYLGLERNGLVKGV
jgi:hypothetical protein